MAELVPPSVDNKNADIEKDANTGGSKLELTVDEIIEEHVGSFGLAQFIHVFIVSAAWIFDAQSTLVTIFSDAQPQWRCTGSSSLCSSSTKTMCGLDRGAWEWVGGNKSSTVAEWELICGDKFKAGIPASLFFIGSLFGSFVQGKLADTYLGRKRTILLSSILTAITAFLTSVSPNVWVYAALRFFNGFSSSGFGTCCLILATEVVGRKWRGQVGQYGFLFFSAGFLSLPLIGYFTRSNWRYIYRILSVIPLVYAFLLIPLVSESPRWLAIKGRTDEAMQVLRKLGKFNRRNTTLPANLAISTGNMTSSTSQERSKSLWSARWALRRVILVMFTGFGVGFVYYGVQINVNNLNFNLYVSTVVNAAIEVPAVFVGSILLNIIPRRVLFSFSTFVAAVATMLCILFSAKKSKSSWPQLSLEAVGFVGAAMAYGTLYIYSAELFPTNVRNFALSMMRLSLMLGATIAPLMVALGPSIPFLVFGGLALVSGMVVFWLPETKDTPLYETLEEQEEEEKLGSRGSVAAEIELAV